MSSKHLSEKHLIRLLREHLPGGKSSNFTNNLLLPSHIANLATTHYKQYHHTDSKLSPILNMEQEAVRQMAGMFGYNTNPEKEPCACGHLTSSAAIAKYECLWSARSISLYPLAMVSVAKKLHLDLKVSPDSDQLLAECGSWKCQNFSIKEVLKLERYCYQQLHEKEGVQSVRNFFKQVNLHSVEHLGIAAFFAEHWDSKQPLVLLPSTADSDWEQAMRLLGFGDSQLIRLDVNHKMRIDYHSLERILSNAEQKKIPILAVIGILGSEEYGSVDPLNKIVQLRDHFSSKGLNFYFHVDAPRGGYLSSLFRDEYDEVLDLNQMQQQFSGFPNKKVHQAFSATQFADSVTMEPGKSGYLPFTIGSLIRKNKNILNLLSRNSDHFLDNAPSAQIQQHNKYKLEESASAIDIASYYYTQKMMPLNSNKISRILSESIRACDYMHKQLKRVIVNLNDRVNMVVPLQPDSNVLCLAINPINNYSLTRMNRFSNRLFEHFEQHLQQKNFNTLFQCTTGSLLHSNIGCEDAKQLFKKLGIKNRSFVVNIDDPKIRTNSVQILTFNLLNPWLYSEVSGKGAIEKYCDYLEQVIVDVVSRESSNSLFAVGAR